MITGTGRRRRFSTDDKARVLEGTLAPSAMVSAVAQPTPVDPAAGVHQRRHAREQRRAAPRSRRSSLCRRWLRHTPRNAGASVRAAWSGRSESLRLSRQCDGSDRPWCGDKDGRGGAARLAERRMIGVTGAQGVGGNQAGRLSHGRRRSGTTPGECAYAKSVFPFRLPRIDLARLVYFIATYRIKSHRASNTIGPEAPGCRRLRTGSNCSTCPST
jgi:transposase-like protein